MIIMRSPIPVLDIHQWYTSPSLFATNLRKACHNVGFFLLKHDIPSEIARDQIDQAREFFQRPMDEKMTISYEDSPSFRGYMQLGTENTAGKVDVREQIELAVETNPSSSSTESIWPPYERLRGLNRWPHVQPEFRSSTLEYVKHATRVATCLRKAMAVALELPSDDKSKKNSMEILFQGKNDELDPPHWVLKLVSYPPLEDSGPISSGRKSDGTSFGVGAHTDTNFLTIILQDDIGGLQVHDYFSGCWVDVPSQHGTDVLVCNLGEQAEILTQGYFRATPHRVVRNASKTQSRISVPLFYNPPMSATIAPVDLPDELLQKWEEKDAGGERSGLNQGGNEDGTNVNSTAKKRNWRMSSNVMLDKVGENTFKSLARSHPAVFQRHHKDLQLLDDGRVIKKSEKASTFHVPNSN